MRAFIAVCMTIVAGTRLDMSGDALRMRANESHGVVRADQSHGDGWFGSGNQYIVLGNPGAGKSTILNSMRVDAGGSMDDKFDSGMSWYGGFTKAFKQLTVGPDKFYDTPGLDDPQLRTAAAKAIKFAFQKGGNFKVFFILSLKGGRVANIDVQTMKKVLDAVPEISKNNYGIIFNKVSKRTMETLYNPAKRGEAILGITSQVRFVIKDRLTSHFDFWGLDPKLDDAPDAVMSFTSEQRHFINSVPVVHVTKGKVDDIATKNWDDEIDVLSKKMSELLGNQSQMVGQLDQAMRENKELAKKFQDLKKQDEINQKWIREQKQRNGAKTVERTASRKR